MITANSLKRLSLLLFLMPLCVRSQNDNSVREGSVRPIIFTSIEKGFGLQPEIDFQNGGMGMNLTRVKLVRGTKRSIAGTAYYTGITFDTQHKLLYASFGTWAGFFRKNKGAQLGLRALYLFRDSEGYLAFRPEAGIGFVVGQLSYGYNIYVNRPEFPYPVHTLTLSAYFALHSTRFKLF